MGFLRRLFGKKDSNTQTTSTQPVKTQSPNLRGIEVIDNRSEEQKQDDRDARDGIGFTVEVQKLIDELIVIGRTDGFESTKPGEKFNERGHHIRAREIGEELNTIGGIRLMQRVHLRYNTVVKNSLAHGTYIIETGRASQLEYAWDGIGYWQR